MNTRYPKLTKKTLTKLFDPAYRQSILSIKQADSKLDEYARYLVKNIITAYPDGNTPAPLSVICAVKGNIVEKRFLDFSTVYSLIKKTGKAKDAVDAVKCILMIWKNADRTITSFDKDIIDKELKTIESKWFKDGKLINNNKEAQDNSEVKTK